MIGLNSQEGPLWGMMLREQDSPWNELFIEDRDANPVLIYRPTPWKDLVTGEYIVNPSGPTSAATASIDIADIVSLTTHRSDYEAANLFWAGNPYAQQSGMMNTILTAALKGEHAATIQQLDYKNNLPSVYGDRAVTTQFRHFPNEVTEHPITAKKEPWQAYDGNFFDFWMGRIDWLRQANQDNVVFENGTMTVKGSEHLRPGMYVRVQRGSFEWECYITSTLHEYQPFGRYTTTCEFIRGTGFYRRLASGQSPYLREGRRGPFDRQ
jgi:hypothetical protein